MAHVSVFKAWPICLLFDSLCDSIRMDLANSNHFAHILLLPTSSQLNKFKRKDEEKATKACKHYSINPFQEIMA